MSGGAGGRLHAIFMLQRSSYNSGPKAQHHRQIAGHSHPLMDTTPKDNVRHKRGISRGHRDEVIDGIKLLAKQRAFSAETQAA